MAYGSSWHFNIGDASLIKPILNGLINETLRSGDGLVYVASPDDNFTVESFREHFGADTKGHVAILDLYGRQPDDSLKDIVIGAGPGSYKDEVKALLSHFCSKKHCHIFMDTGALEDSMAIEQASRTYADMLGMAREKGIILVTFSGPLSKGTLSASIESSSDGVIDVWDYAGYALLQIKKAPYAKSFEPYIIKLEDGHIKIMPI